MGGKKSCKSLLDHNGLPKEPLCVCVTAKTSVLLRLDIHQDPPHSSLMSLLCTNLMLVSFGHITFQWRRWTKPCQRFLVPSSAVPQKENCAMGRHRINLGRWSSKATQQSRRATQRCKAGTIWFTCDLNLICAGGLTPLQMFGYPIEQRSKPEMSSLYTDWLIGFPTMDCDNPHKIG